MPKTHFLDIGVSEEGLDGTGLPPPLPSRSREREQGRRLNGKGIWNWKERGMSDQDQIGRHTSVEP